MDDAHLAFEQVIYGRLIAEFCSHRVRGCDPAGFNRASMLVGPQDAQYFLRAFEGGLVKHQGRGLYRAAASATSEQFFWEGRKAMNPRPFTLWLEPIITVAGVARLHFDYRWPKHLIGTQSADWAFDLVTFMPGQSDEFIAGEVKKTPTEIHQLLKLMQRFGEDPIAGLPRAGKERNAYMKISALRARRPPIFWALGPDGLSKVYRVGYGRGGAVNLIAADESALMFPG
jgi:hypothetical protein